MQIEILFFNLHKTGFVVKSAFNFLLRHGSFKRPKGAGGLSSPRKSSTLLRKASASGERRRVGFGLLSKC